MTALVFGRTEYAEPLAQVGESDGDVREAFPGEWVELIAFPVESVHWIVCDGKEVEGERSDVRARD